MLQYALRLGNGLLLISTHFHFQLGDLAAVPPMALAHLLTPRLVDVDACLVQPRGAPYSAPTTCRERALTPALTGSSRTRPRAKHGRGCAVHPRGHVPPTQTGFPPARALGDSWRGNNGILQGCRLTVILMNLLATLWKPEINSVRRHVALTTAALAPLRDQPDAAPSLLPPLPCLRAGGSGRANARPLGSGQHLGDHT